jgi:hypothetical protein
MFFTLVSKTDQCGSVMLNVVIVLDREDAEVHLRARQTMTKQFQLSSWKTASFIGNNVWIMGFT